MHPTHSPASALVWILARQIVEEARAAASPAPGGSGTLPTRPPASPENPR
jgi:hypothetical protein